MAFVFIGTTRCDLCGEVLAADDDFLNVPVGFFVPGKPFGSLSHLNDAFVHVECLRAPPWGPEALARLEHHFARKHALREGDEAAWAEFLEERRRYLEGPDA